jgi:hypothetical protein
LCGEGLRLATLQADRSAFLRNSASGQIFSYSSALYLAFWQDRAGSCTKDRSSHLLSLFDQSRPCLLRQPLGLDSMTDPIKGSSILALSGGGRWRSVILARIRESPGTLRACESCWKGAVVHRFSRSLLENLSDLLATSYFMDQGPTLPTLSGGPTAGVARTLVDHPGSTAATNLGDINQSLLFRQSQ